MRKTKIENKAVSQGNLVKPGKKLWLTVNGNLVATGHPAAHALWCTENDYVDRKEYEHLIKGSRHADSG